MPKVAPAISDAERDVLIQAVSAFTVQQIRELLREHHLSIGGTKDELISRLGGALSDGAVAAGEVVGLLDACRAVVEIPCVPLQRAKADSGALANRTGSPPPPSPARR